MKQFLSLLLAALLLAMLLPATAEDAVVAPPVEANVGELENVGLPAPKYTSGNLAHFVHPSDGDVLEPGNVEIHLTYDDDGLWSSSGNLLTDAELYDNYMPTYLTITKDGHSETVEIRNNNITFNGTSKRYATISLTEPGLYTLRIASHKGTSNPETITVTVGSTGPDPTPTMPIENPGYYLIPEKDEYTVNLAHEDRVRFNFRLSLYREETNFWWGFGQEGDDILEMVDDYGDVSNGGEPLVLHEEDGRYVCDTHITFKATGVGTQRIGIAVYVNGAEYDKHDIVFHVINDPSATPEPSPTPTPTPGTSAAPSPSPTTTPAPTTVTSPVKISKCKIAAIKNQTYTGKALKPALTVKYNGVKLEKGADYTVTWKNNIKIGLAAATIKGKGAYTGSKKVTFKIIPKTVAIKKLTAGKKQLTVQWKKAAGGAGVQIQYSLKKSMALAKTVTVAKNATVKKAVKKLKSGKTYYVRIRGYKKVSGKTYVSAWSKVKAVKVK